jgi:malate dehydrogenase (oxaloacetate-decarboxylating)(NADP+)
LLQAALGIANLCVKAMVTEGTDESEAQSHIWMMDIDGLLVKSRPKEKLLGKLCLNLFIFNF